jgi:predicted RNase H-like HicB family nuclease
MSIPDNDIRIECDAAAEGFHTTWRPCTAVGLGSDEREALEDLREAAHFYIDTMVDLKLEEIEKGLST